jgi:diacylglycerol kinase family enzyme
MALELPQNKATAVTEATSDQIVLEYASDSPKKTILISDLIAIVPAPRQHGYTETDQLILSVGGSSTDTRNSDADPVDKYALDTYLVPSLPEVRYRLKELPEHLQRAKEDIHVVVSTLSGAHEAEEFFDRILSPVFSLIGLQPEQYTVHRTTSEQSVTNLGKNVLGPRANEGRAQTVVLLSGDGGIVDTINGVLSCTRTKNFLKPVLGLLALGTGNALANSSALNTDSSKGLSNFLQGTPHDIPTFQARFSAGALYLTNEGQDKHPLPQDEQGNGVLNGAVASWGLHASLVADSDTTEYRKHGAQRFSMAAQELLAPADGSSPHNYRGKVTLFKLDASGRTYSVNWQRDRHMYILATFVSNLERALTISPESRPLDGKLRLLNFGVLGGDEVNDVFAKAYDGGKHTTLDSVGYEEIEGIRIVFEEAEGRWRRVCIDGKIVMVEEGGWFEVHKERESGLQLVTVV